MHVFCPPAVRRLALLGTLFVAAACDETEPSTPSQIAGVPTQSVQGRAGQAVPVIVRVTASNGRALEGQTVTFNVASGGGTVAPATAQTDANGQAQTVWTLGSAVGAQTITATVGSVTPLTVTAAVTAGLPARVEVQGGNNQSAPVGTTVTTPPAIVVRDAGGNPVPNAQVVFSVLSGGGSVSGGVTTTDASGVARVGSFQLGSTAGPNTLQAQVLGGAGTQPLTVNFTATGTAGAASRIETQAGNGTTATAGVAVTGTNLPAVLVTDANRNPVQGVQVTFTVTSGGGTITGGTQTTNAQGIATLGGLTLGQTAGPNIITAVAPGTQPVTFTVTGQAGPAARLEVVGGNNQEARAAAALQAAPTVRVVDQFGNPVAGVSVTFAPTGGGAAVTGPTQTTNAQGVAAAGGVTLGATPGTNTVEARVAGLQPAVFTATGLAGAPATITRVTVDTVRVVAFEQTPALTVLVRDAEGFPVRGATVTFAVDSAKAGTVTPASATTNAQGQASTRLTAGAVVDTATITATVGNLAGVTFTAVIAQNTPASVRLLQGSGQVATAGTNVAVAPAVEVRDAAGRPVAGVPVAFSIVSANLGGGVVPQTTPGSYVENATVIDSTDATGRAEVGAWQLGGTPGENILTIVVQAPNVSGNPVRVTAQGNPIPTAGTTITQVSGNNQTAPVGGLVPTPPSVVVRNAAGAPLAGVTVEFIPSVGGLANGSATAVAVQTNANGVAQLTSWRLSPNAGVNTLTASVVGAGVSTQFTATGQ
jgi:adhesin/invasin